MQPWDVTLLAPQFEAMAGASADLTWGANVVRVTMSQDFWLNDTALTFNGPLTAAQTSDGMPRDYAGLYTKVIDNVVYAARAAGMVVILDLHWSDGGNKAADTIMVLQADGTLCTGEPGTCPGGANCPDLGTWAMCERTASAMDSESRQLTVAACCHEGTAADEPLHAESHPLHPCHLRFHLGTDTQNGMWGLVGQQMLPDPGSVEFWTDVAARYGQFNSSMASNGDIMFEVRGWHTAACIVASTPPSPPQPPFRTPLTPSAAVQRAVSSGESVLAYCRRHARRDVVRLALRRVGTGSRAAADRQQRQLPEHHLCGHADPRGHRALGGGRTERAACGRYVGAQAGKAAPCCCIAHRALGGGGGSVICYRLLPSRG
jgi:hypothetical protein